MCGGHNRPSGNGCWDCFWDENEESEANPDQDVRPNYISLNEARFIVEHAGVEVLKRANQGGIKA